MNTVFRKAKESSGSAQFFTPSNTGQCTGALHNLKSSKMHLNLNFQVQLVRLEVVRVVTGRSYSTACKTERARIQALADGTALRTLRVVWF